MLIKLKFGGILGGAAGNWYRIWNKNGRLEDPHLLIPGIRPFVLAKLNKPLGSLGSLTKSRGIFDTELLKS